MAIRIMCPNLKCRRILAVPPDARGKTIRCRNCGAMVEVPQQGAAKPEAPAAVETSAESDDS